LSQQQITYGEIAREGLWTRNTALVQLLGLCPLLAVTTTTVNGLGLGIATLAVLLGSNILVSLCRHLIPQAIRIPIYVLIIATLVTTVELLMRAWFYELFHILGIFIPLIVTNCAIIARAEAFASRNPLPRAIVDGFSTGLGFAACLVVLGSMRELVGHGTLLADAHLMFGEGARGLTLTVIPEYPGFLLALLPPGAFIALGLLVALKNVIDRRLAQPAPATEPGHPAATATD